MSTYTLEIPFNDGTQGAAVLDVTRMGEDLEGRTQYEYAINVGTVARMVADDLSTGVGMDHGPRAMMGTLLSFLSACAESVNYGGGENSDLFAPAIAEWAAQHSDEITMAGLEIEGIED